MHFLEDRSNVKYFFKAFQPFFIVKLKLTITKYRFVFWVHFYTIQKYRDAG